VADGKKAPVKISILRLPFPDFWCTKVVALTAPVRRNVPTVTLTGSCSVPSSAPFSTVYEAIPSNPWITWRCSAVDKYQRERQNKERSDARLHCVAIFANRNHSE